jgi:hypothetical protein
LEAETTDVVAGKTMMMMGVGGMEYDTRTEQYGDDDANASVLPHLAPP